VTKAEAIAIMREITGHASPPPPPRPLPPEPEPLASRRIVRDPVTWQVREDWITRNGGTPLPRIED
jgi:hypothetical protein